MTPPAPRCHPRGAAAPSSATVLRIRSRAEGHLRRRTDGSGVTPPSASLPRPPWNCRLRGLCLITRHGWRPTLLAVVDYARTPVGPYREAFVALATGPWSARVPWIIVDDPASAEAGRAWWNL